MSTTEPAPTRQTTLDMRRGYLFAHEEARAESYRLADRANALKGRARKWGRAGVTAALASLGADVFIPGNTLAEKIVGWAGAGVTAVLGGVAIERYDEQRTVQADAAQAERAANTLLTAEIVTAAADGRAPAPWARHQLLKQTLPELIDPQADYPMPDAVYRAVQPAVEQYLPQDAA